MKKKSNVSVAVRIRPCENNILSRPQRSCLHLSIPEEDYNKEYIFDRVFNEEDDDEQIFQETGKQTINSMLEGYQSSLFVYGQSGSGKSYTMLGHQKNYGIVHRSLLYLMRKKEQSNGLQIHVSAVEILKIQNVQKVMDLLEPTSKSLEFSMVKGVNQTKWCINDEKIIEQFMKRVKSQRLTHPTPLNEESSRSFLVIKVFLKQSDNTKSKDEPYTVVGAFIDLAGSQDFTQPDSTYINLNLLYFKMLLKALQLGTFANYRQGKINSILKDFINSKSRISILGLVRGEQIHCGITQKILTQLSQMGNIKVTLESKNRKTINQTGLFDKEKQKNKNLTEKCSKLLDQIQQDQQHRKQLYQQLSSQKAKNDKLIEQLTVLKELRNKDQQYNNNLSQQLTKQRKNNQNLTLCYNQLKDKMEGIQRQSKYLGQSLSKANNTINKMNKQNYNFSQQILKSKDKINILQQQLIKSKHKIEQVGNFEDQITELIHQNSSLQHRLINQRVQNLNLKRQNQNIEKKLAISQKKVLQLMIPQQSIKKRPILYSIRNCERQHMLEQGIFLPIFKQMTKASKTIGKKLQKKVWFDILDAYFTTIFSNVFPLQRALNHQIKDLLYKHFEQLWRARDYIEVNIHNLNFTLLKVGLQFSQNNKIKDKRVKQVQKNIHKQDQSE